MHCLRDVSDSQPSLLEQDRVSALCLHVKDEDWEIESTDEDFEIESKHCFVSGISTEGVDEFDMDGIEPARHGVSEAMISNVHEGDDAVCPQAVLFTVALRYQPSEAETDSMLARSRGCRCIHSASKCSSA